MKKLASKSIFQLRKLFRRQVESVRIAANRVTRFKAKREQEQRDGVSEGVSPETIDLLSYIHGENVHTLNFIAAEAARRTSPVKREPEIGTAGAPAPHVHGETR